MENKENPMTKSGPFRTICEVLREINDLHQESTPHDELIRGKLLEAVNMGKRMDKALREEYGHRLSDEGYWEKNPNFKKIQKRRRGNK
jgi:hypothetical protein